MSDLHDPALSTGRRKVTNRYFMLFIQTFVMQWRRRLAAVFGGTRVPTFIQLTTPTL